MFTRMQWWARLLGHGIGVSALLLLPSRVALGQQGAFAAPDLARAQQLHDKADALMATNQRGHWKSVAHLLEQAAALRAEDDSLAVTERVVAGQLFHYTGALARAQANFESAADLALANGRVLQAAEAYLTAAIVANSRERPQEAMELGRKAELLARSPHLTQQECGCILDRIIWLPGKQVAAR